jgi:predicted AlkP superfamily phosphohydrolase/phosphomutase
MAIAASSAEVLCACPDVILTNTLGQIFNKLTPVLEAGEFEFLVMYSPVPDEVAHVFTGYLDPAVPGHDETLARELWPTLARAFQTQDELLGWVMEHASRVGAHVVLVSDHGMAGTRWLLNVNIALQRAGLLALTPDREIDLSRTRALLLPLSDASVAVNTVDRKGGIVPMEDEETVLKRVREVLEQVIDPETGNPVVKGFFPASRQGLLQPGGETTGDVFLDLVPGYCFSSSTEKDELITATEPSGNHIFLPTRRDMLAIFGAWGPQFHGGIRLPRVQAIDVAPTVLDLLDLEIPNGLPGRSLMPAKAMIEQRSRCWRGEEVRRRGLLRRCSLMGVNCSESDSFRD